MGQWELPTRWENPLVEDLAVALSGAGTTFSLSLEAYAVPCSTTQAIFKGGWREMGTSQHGWLILS